MPAAARTVGDIMEDLARDGIGGNNPPSPFDEVAALVAEARDEARMWLDGQPVASQEQADGLAQLLDMARKAAKASDDARKAEAKPFDDGKAAVQARYKPLITDAERVADTLKAAIGQWLVKVAAAQRAEAEAKRIEAERLAAEARAVHAVADQTNLAEREAAEQSLKDADRARHIAEQAARATATAKSVTGSKAVGLRTYYRADVNDPMAFGKYLWANHNAEYLGWLATVAARMVAADKCNFPGVVAVAEQRAA